MQTPSAGTLVTNGTGATLVLPGSVHAFTLGRSTIVSSPAGTSGPGLAFPGGVPISRPAVSCGNELEIFGNTVRVTNHGMMISRWSGNTQLVQAVGNQAGTHESLRYVARARTPSIPLSTNSG